jgi:hypothetical protein
MGSGQPAVEGPLCPRRRSMCLIPPSRPLRFLLAGAQVSITDAVRSEPALPLAGTGTAGFRDERRGTGVVCSTTRISQSQALILWIARIPHA